MIKTLRKFFSFCGPDESKKFILSIWLGVLGAVLSAMRIPAVYLVIKAIVEGSMTYGTLFLSFGIILVSLILSILVSMKSTMLQTEGGYTACANKRIEIAEHLRYLPMGWFNENSLGEVTSVATNTMENLANVATRVVMLTTKGILTCAAIAVMMLIYDRRIGLITVLGLIAFLAVNALMQKSEIKVSESKFKADENLVSKVLDFVRGIAEVKNYNLTGGDGGGIFSEIESAVDETRRANFAMEIPSVIFIFLQFIVNKFTGVAVCFASLVFYFRGTMPLPDCILMLICSFVLFEQLDSAGSYSALLRTVDISTEKADDVLKTEPMDIDGRDIVPPNFDIALENVDFSYSADAGDAGIYASDSDAGSGKRKIIDDVSMNIPAKSVVAIVGPSGGGKTTLCNLMARFWDVRKGRVTLGGTDVRDYSFDSLIKNFSFVFQRTYLFSDTVANNIRFGCPSASMEEVISAAKRARCHDFIMNLPDGYATLLGEGGASISGGERQRITIARAIMKNAPIIILDEATANVDPENESELIQAMDELTENKTVIIIAHRLKTVRKADCIYVVDAGKIAESGTHEELISREGIYRRFVEEREKAAIWKVS